MRRRALLASMAAIGCAGSFGQAFADTLQNIKSSGELVVGVKADYRPFGYRSPNGDIVGIGPDLARDIAKRLGVKVKLVPVVASNRMQFLNQGKIDLMIATMNDTPERRKVVDIVQPDYYASGYNVMLPKSAHITSWAGLKGRAVCGVQGSYYQKPVQENYGVQVVSFRGTTEALAAVKQGRCIGLLYDNTAIDGILLEPEWGDAYHMPLETLDAIPWGMAVRKGDTKLAAIVSDAIRDWEKTGFILNLETKYGITNHSKFAEDAHNKYK